MANSPKLGFVRIVQNQAGGDTIANGDFNIVEALLQNGVINRTTNTPPGSPAEGDAYIVGSSPTGAWAGQANRIQSYYNGWSLTGIIPTEGFKIWNLAEDCYNFFDGSSWSAQDTTSRTTGISAAGTTQGTATALTRDVNFVTSATGGSADGLILPSAPSVGAATKTVINDTAATIKIYPPSGGSIDSLGTNAAYSLATGKTVQFFSRTTTQFRSLLSA